MASMVTRSAAFLNTVPSMSKKRSFAGHVDLLLHAIESIAVIIFGVPARNAECVQAIAERPGVTSDHQIDFAVALQLQIEDGNPFTNGRLRFKDMERQSRRLIDRVLVRTNRAGN